MRALAEAGAALSLKDAQGKTPQVMAKEQKYKDVAGVIARLIKKRKSEKRPRTRFRCFRSDRRGDYIWGLSPLRSADVQSSNCAVSVCRRVLFA